MFDLINTFKIMYASKQYTFIFSMPEVFIIFNILSEVGEIINWADYLMFSLSIKQEELILKLKRKLLAFG